MALGESPLERFQRGGIHRQGGDVMNYLHAQATLKAFRGGPDLPLRVATSGNAEPIELYFRAAAAELGYNAQVSFLPFGTLRQTLLDSPPAETREVLLLFPWDLVPELDWRTGVPDAMPDELDARRRAEDFVSQVSGRGSPIVYVDAPAPPVSLDPARNAAWNSSLRAEMERIGATIMPETVFGLSGYLASGQPIALKTVGDVARAVLRAAVAPPQAGAKVLVTDLDHTLWHGIIGDDGLAGIHFRPEGKGYRHFLYQTFLRRLRADGVLLVAVSKNDDAVARQPFQAGEMVLREDDFVAIVASWQPKSAQISMLAEQLNLGLDAFVFVDDNPVEIAEVAARLPEVTCVTFPSGEHGMQDVLDTLVQHFRRSVITAEDRQRTALYQRRITTLPPREGSASDLRGFLRDLGMTLLIEERTHGDRTRAVQLINKTNQFNLNGIRLEDVEVDRLIADGSRLFTAALTDRSGDHGQILSMLVAPDGTVTSLVMSCRVFQRRVEYAFLAWLVSNGVEVRSMQYRETARNTPIRAFLEFCTDEPVVDGTIRVSPDRSRSAFQDDLELFTVHAPVVSS